MIYLINDYTRGAHPRILEALAKANDERNVGYGDDPHSENAKRIIREKIGCPDAQVEFFTGGTVTNMIALSSFLKSYEAVIAVETGHICEHETGSVETTGHKVIHTKGINAKIDPDEIVRVCKAHNMLQMVQPKVVYISESTEFGTVYTKDELKNLKKVCEEYGLYLYIDGARLASALASEEAGITWTDLPEVCDAFYIGGTKIGLLFGEALVIMNDDLKEEKYVAIQREYGALLAKGYLYGIQFETLLEGDFFVELGRQQNRLAQTLAARLREKGVKFSIESPTNQIFPIFTHEKVAELAQKVHFEFWDPNYSDTHEVIRFVTGWHSTEQDIEELLALI